MIKLLTFYFKANSALWRDIFNVFKFSSLFDSPNWELS